MSLIEMANGAINLRELHKHFIMINDVRVCFGSLMIFKKEKKLSTFLLIKK